MMRNRTFGLITLILMACSVCAEGPLTTHESSDAANVAPLIPNLSNSQTGLIPAPAEAPSAPPAPAVPNSPSSPSTQIIPSLPDVKDIGHEGPRQELKLKPQVQVANPSSDYKSLSFDKIKPYLKVILEVNLEVYKTAPTLSMSTNRSDLMATGSQVFVKGKLDTQQKYYQVANKFLIYRHPKTKQILGYGAPISGEAKLIKDTTPMVIELTSCLEAIDPTARVFPRNEYILPKQLNIKSSQTESTGYIIAGAEGYDMGVHDVITLSLGHIDKVFAGDVVNLYQSPGIMDTKQVAKLMGRDKLPLQKVGQALIYKVYEKFSHALIVESSQPIRTQAIVRAP